MKKLLLYVLIPLALLTSCGGGSAPQKLNSFVLKTEVQADRYTPADWNRSCAQYEAHLRELERGRYSPAEQQIAARAIGRYHALMLKYGIKESASSLKQLDGILSSYLDGFTDEFGSNRSELEQDLHNLLETGENFGSDLEESLSGLEALLEEIANSLEE